MSEFSESFHIRTDQADEALKRLQKRKIGGVAFPARDGWVTFVPHAGNPIMQGNAAQEIMAAAESPVLHYRFAEDHGWSFELWQPRRRPIVYRCSWDPEPIEDRARFDAAGLSEIMGGSTAPAEIEGVLAGPEHYKDAYRFAKLLKLPAYQWLSPDYVQSDPDEVMSRGGKPVGRPPKDPLADVPKPPGRIVKLPRKDISAREAFELIESIMAPHKPNYIPCRLYTQAGTLDESGRLAEGAGWEVYYRSTTDRGQVTVLIVYRGEVFVRPGRIDMIGTRLIPVDLKIIPPPVALPEHWLDSFQVMTFVESEPLPPASTPYSRPRLSLEAYPNAPACWCISRGAGQHGLTDFVEHDWYIHAGTGEILAEHFVRKNTKHEIIEEWRKPRPALEKYRPRSPHA